MNEFLPYYRYWSNEDVRFTKEYTEITRAGHDLWSTMGYVVPLQGNDGEELYKVYDKQYVCW